MRSLSTLFATLALFGMEIPCAAALEGLTWTEAAKEASIGNPDIRSAEESLAKSKSQVGAAFSAFLPVVAGSVSYVHGNTSSASGSVSAFGASATTDQYSLGVTATQNLFNGFQDRAALLQARANQNAAEANLRAQKATVHQQLKKAFYQLVYAQQAESLLRRIEKRRRDNFHLVELRFSGGRENKGAFLKSRGQWRQAQFAVKQNRRNILVAQQQLAVLMGRRDSENIRVVGTLTTKEIPADLKSIDALARETPAVEQTSANLVAAQAASQASFGSLLPSLSLTGSLSKVGLTFPPDTNRWTVGLTLTVPIFRYSNFANLSGMRADERRAEFASSNADRQAVANLTSALTALQLAAENVSVQADVKEASEVRAEIARGQYTSGLCSFNDWDIIETDLITQEQGLLLAKQGAVNAEADWEQAVGRGDIP